ncbi:TetR/AcrR family transcriptional regulator [Streptomyces sp. HUAS MG47]|uniref:TetR/AcrR family transcriptional regulator n=1 Tax=Streptomyces solicamelliae TaxID=3231716 RepID=UPI003877E026
MVEYPVTPQLAPRPAPVTRRGVARVQALLDAAEQILGEEGYEAATLGAVAKRAGIPVASVYHYFADRHQVDAALMRRHAEAITVLVREAAADPELRTLRDVVDALIDPQLAYCREHPSAVELWHAPGRSPMLVELEEGWGQAQAEEFWYYLLDRELIVAETPLLAVEVAYEAADRIFGVAFQGSPTGHEATIEEARRLMTAYLETYSPKTPESPKRRR